MIRSAFVATSLLLLAGCHARDETPKATRAWARLPAVSGGAAAAYFTLKGGSRADRLVRIESALAQRVEMHESMTGMAGMAMMKPLAGINVPAGGTVTFAPGGNHAMLYGLDPVVTPGTAIPLRLGFASGKTSETEAKTVAAGGDAPY